MTEAARDKTKPAAFGAGSSGVEAARIVIMPYGTLAVASKEDIVELAVELNIVSDRTRPDATKQTPKVYHILAIILETATEID